MHTQEEALTIVQNDVREPTNPLKDQSIDIQKRGINVNCNEKLIQLGGMGIRKGKNMNTIRKITKYSLIAILAYVILVGEYHIWWKKEEYTKTYSGTVIHSYISYGRHSSECLATVRFDNGDIDEVNTGGYLYTVGQRFSGRLHWTPFLGVSGTAYSWHPPDSILFFVMPAVVFNILVILSIIWFLFMFAFLNG